MSKKISTNDQADTLIGEASNAEIPSDSTSPDMIDAKRAFEMGTDSQATIKIPANWSPPEPEELDLQFPDYTITKLIGRGGMGAVYKAMQKSLDRHVAIKLLPPELADSDPSFASRFEREAKSMARLDHPNIVHVYDFGQTQAGQWFIVMEFVDGTDFHQLIRSGELDVTAALNAVSQICDALDYAHGMGYVHRDIKPENIFINSKGALKIGDFGLAKIIEGEAEEGSENTSETGLTMTGVSMGTAAYSAPEQMEGRATDHRADIYSLGVMFYEMLTRELPRGNFPPPSKKVEVDVRIDEVVLRAMESERDRRYSSAADMRTELDSARSASPIPKSETKEESIQAATAGHADSSATKKTPNNAKLFGIIALSLLGIGLLSPFLIFALSSWHSASWHSGMMAMFFLVPVIFVLAFIFGILGWKHPTGKVATIASACLGGLALIFGVVFILWTSVKEVPSSSESDPIEIKYSSP